MISQTSKGFTLIELLVVIAIIGLLATMAVVSFGNAQSKARDAKRIADVKQIMKALELYYDENGSYIGSGNCASTIPNTGWCNSVQSMSGGHWLRNGATNLGAFLGVDPVDPSQGASAVWLASGTYFYYSASCSNQWYMIVFGLENTDNPILDSDGVSRCGGVSYHYGSATYPGIVTIGMSTQ